MLEVKILLMPEVSQKGIPDMLSSFAPESVTGIHKDGENPRHLEEVMMHESGKEKLPKLKGSFLMLIIS